MRAAGRRNAGLLAFLAGYSLNRLGAHLGGELSYNCGLRVNRNVFEWCVPGEFTPVLEESELPEGGMRKVSVDGAKVLVSWVEDGRICALSNVCGHFAGPLAKGEREGDTVVCPWHGSCFNLCAGEAIDGHLPEPRYERRAHEGTIKAKVAE